MTLDQLEKIALEASPGPWKLRAHPNGREAGCFVQGQVPSGMPYALEVLGDDYNGFGGDRQRIKDVEFVAAFNPIVVLQLIKTIKQLRSFETSVNEALNTGDGSYKP